MNCAAIKCELMKKVLYISNTEVPYRVKFFNLLAEQCDLTVLYEREKSSNRNSNWARSECIRYKVKYLGGMNVGNENSFSLRILKVIFGSYDSIIIGCYNSPVQMFAMLVMRLFGIRFIINLDGEPFLEGNGLKSRLKRFFLAGAEKYLVAGEKSADSLCKAFGNCEAIPYYFSSLTEQELIDHREAAKNCIRTDTILVVGQYFDYKGMDVALEAARMDQTLHYKFVGMGGRTELFLQDHAGRIPSNVEIIPFLQKAELEEEYKKCAMLVLPSRQECWGLVINEAASFGTPIVSTWGSGAAVEFLADAYPQYLAKPGDVESMLDCIRKNLASDNVMYSRDLLDKVKDYCIEKNVKKHLELIN